MKVKVFFRSIFILLLFLTIQLHASTCLGEKIPVVASIFPITDMVRQIGGEYVDVVTAIPAGAGPHTFEPKPSLIKKIFRARIFFMVGIDLEFWAEKFIKLSENHLTAIVLSEGVSLIYNTAEHHHGNSGHHDNCANPHIWLDPEIAKSIIDKITIGLCKIDDKHSEYYKQRSKAYLNNLYELHLLISRTVEKFRIRKYVALHPSWDYFARQYGLECVGIIETAPGRNPTPKQIGKIVSNIKKHKIRAVFAEPQLNPKVAEVIAEEADIKVILLDPIGGPGIKGRDTYINLMKYNLNALQKAML